MAKKSSPSAFISNHFQRSCSKLKLKELDQIPVISLISSHLLGNERKAVNSRATKVPFESSIFYKDVMQLFHYETLSKRNNL